MKCSRSAFCSRSVSLVSFKHYDKTISFRTFEIINLNKGVNNLNDHPKMETFNISKLTFTRVINTANYIDIYNQACTLKERP